MAIGLTTNNVREVSDKLYQSLGRDFDFVSTCQELLNVDPKQKGERSDRTYIRKKQLSDTVSGYVRPVTSLAVLIRVKFANSQKLLLCRSSTREEER